MGLRREPHSVFWRRIFSITCIFQEGVNWLRKLSVETSPSIKWTRNKSQIRLTTLHVTVTTVLSRCSTSMPLSTYFLQGSCSCCCHFRDNDIDDNNHYYLAWFILWKLAVRKDVDVKRYIWLSAPQSKFCSVGLVKHFRCQISFCKYSFGYLKQIWPLCAFFWVISWGLNFTCRRFGTLSVPGS